MTALELANKYMEIVFGGGDLNELSNILDPGLRFDGPFFSFDSAAAYKDSLKESPPEGFRYTLIHASGDETSACIFYEFTKPGILTPMAQMFQTEGDRIKRILLVFDTKAFG